MAKENVVWPLASPILFSSNLAQQLSDKCDRSARLVNMAPLVANGEALLNVSMSVYVYLCLCLSLSMSMCDRSARLVNMAPLVANGEALHNGEIELYLQRNLGKHHGFGCEIVDRILHVDVVYGIVFIILYLNVAKLVLYYKGAVLLVKALKILLEIYIFFVHHRAPLFFAIMRFIK
jgi:hypothetical protein